MVSKNKQAQNKNHFRKTKLVSTATIVVLLAACGGFYLASRRHAVVLQATSKSTIETGAKTNKNIANKTNLDVPTPTPTENVPGTVSDGQGQADANASALQTPNGTFASSYTPSLDSQEYSSCNTTPGASCTITFTSNASGLTKSLPTLVAVTSKAAQTGTAVWSSWTPLSVGLTQGNWQVSATATLNGQTKTATSTQTLEVE